MRFFTLALNALAVTATVLPVVPRQEDGVSLENIHIRDFSLRNTQYPNGTFEVNSVYFSLTGDNATDLECSVTNPAYPVPDEVTTCGDSKYRFSLHQGNQEGYNYALRIYHELGLAVGRWGQGNIASYCHAGGMGPGDFICAQVANATIVISSNPPPINP